MHGFHPEKTALLGVEIDSLHIRDEGNRHQKILDQAVKAAAAGSHARKVAEESYYVWLFACGEDYGATRVRLRKPTGEIEHIAPRTSAPRPSTVMPGQLADGISAWYVMSRVRSIGRSAESCSEALGASGKQAHVVWRGTSGHFAGAAGSNTSLRQKPIVTPGRAAAWREKLKKKLKYSIDVKAGENRRIRFRESFMAVSIRALSEALYAKYRSYLRRPPEGRGSPPTAVPDELARTYVRLLAEKMAAEQNLSPEQKEMVILLLTKHALEDGLELKEPSDAELLLKHLSENK